MVTEKWISIDGPRSEVWFQDWSNYKRLFIKIYKDTLKVAPSPYATKTKNKPYLYPKPFKLYEIDQMIGNLFWEKEISWENGYENTFLWKIDRSNPKRRLPINYTGVAKNDNGRLKLVIKDNDNLIFDVLLLPLKYNN